MNTASYGEFSLGLHKHFGNTRTPLEVTLEVTRRCPLDCQHCYNNLPMADKAAQKSELTTAEYFRLLDELFDEGTLWLLFTGGEIFARADFLDIYKYAKEKGFLITLFTNGVMLTTRIADFLAEYRPFAIEITLYGATKETYEALTQIPGSFEKCMRGIRLLQERKLPLKLKTVPTTINRHEVFEMQRMAEQDLGVEFKFDPLVNPRIDCSQSPIEVRLNAEEVVALDFHDPKRRRDYGRLVASELAAPLPEETGQVYQCGGGVTGCAIDPQGGMSICVLSHQETYNVRDGSFREGWNGFLHQTRTKPKTRATKCDKCHIKSLCSMCPANGELEAGDAEKPVEFLCEVAHIRALALDVKIPAHGACECCEGGTSYTAIAESAEKIRNHKIDVGSWTPTLSAVSATLLPILQESAGCGTSRGNAGGCGSCGTHG